MRISFALGIVITLAACGKDGTSTGTDAPVTADTPAFTISSKEVTLQPGDQITYCYYFHTSNTSEVLINKWVSDMSPGSHHAILFMNPGGTQPADGTIDSNGCGGLSGTAAPVWTYATQTPHQEVDLPTDDGNGKPLAQKIAPNSQGYLQLHYLNSGDAPITAHIDLKAYALGAGLPYTQTDAYVTYNQDIHVAPGAVGQVVSASCPLPAGVKFWSMSTHSHKQSMHTAVNDGTSSVFASDQWEHPGAQAWMTAPFYTFTASQLTWACTYNNNAPPPYCNAGGSPGDCSNANITVNAGQSAVTNEMCMATGYFFPSTGPKFEVMYNGSCIGL